MWSLFAKGGITMIPLTALSVIGLAVVIEKFISLRNSKVLRQEVLNCIDLVRTRSDIPMAIKICERYDTPLANIIRAGLEEVGAPVADIRQHMEDTGRREVKRLERYLFVLETVAAASPLLGLLGTVFGIFKVFSVISIEGVGVAGSLAGGIAEALITTAFGLSIGIPSLVLYNLFDSRVENLSAKIEGSAHALLKKLTAMERGSSGEVAGPRIREISDGA